MKVEKIKVYVWGELVGELFWDCRKNTSYFRFVPSFKDKGLDLFPLLFPIEKLQDGMVYWGELEKHFMNLPAFVADSLPDMWGRRLLELWQKSNDLSNSDFTPIDKLAFIGKRGMGALEFVAESEQGVKPEYVELSSLIDFIYKIDSKDDIMIQQEDVRLLQTLVSIGTSAGGCRPKVIISINDETGDISFDPECDLKGYTPYILKFNNEKLCSAEIEQTYYQMACNAGIKMMPSRLLNIGGRNHFLTQRFDRVDGEKVHLQTLLALNPEANSYEALIDVCKKLHLPDSDVEAIFRQLVFNVLANNTDDHNKNFSFMMNKDGKWALTPAYDLTYIMSDENGKPDTSHCMYIHSKAMSVSKQDVLDFAMYSGVSNPENIISEVVEALMGFRALAKANGVKDEFIGAIESCVRSRLAEWNLVENKALALSYEENGCRIENAQLSKTYKAGFRLTAHIDGIEYRYNFNKKSEEYAQIMSVGYFCIEEDYIKALVRKYLMIKIK